jgi:predicted secreted Zn-dependent protease
MEQIQLDLPEDNNPVNVEELVAIYVKIRDVIRSKEEQHKEEIAVIQAQLDTISSKLLEVCSTQNTDSMRTAAGTVSRRVQSRYWTSDWESMHNFIVEHKVPFILEKRIHNSNMKEFLSANPDVLPMGMQMENKYVIQVRKATQK